MKVRLGHLLRLPILFAPFLVDSLTILSGQSLLIPEIRKQLKVSVLELKSRNKLNVSLIYTAININTFVQKYHQDS